MKFRSALTLSLLLSACGQADDPGSKSADTVAATKPGTTQSTGLSSAYLEGQWCHTHNIMGDERSDEMLSYIFSQDGTLLYQNNPTTEIDRPGTYVIEGRNLKIKPTLAFFNMELESMSQDEFILKMAYGKMYWSRGACKPTVQ
ncbi:MAG: hypothetical protein ACI9TB_001208 [Parasphingorhabdus sp.]|jgi:hypothetical protein|uniref:hypothetical protein n=1 Tax=Parasphingorhabdus sp. TaxID=2709688 RepID=UPI0039E667FD|tara:strand:- start:1817 stop:2248 length:432 start_codon:yes stop_codon:yes gene_type:complete